VDVDGVAPPLDPRAVDADHEPRQLGDRRGRGVAARFPRGVEQHDVARVLPVLHRDRLAHGEDLVVCVGGGDGEVDAAAERPIARRRQRRGRRGGDRPGPDLRSTRPRRPEHTEGHQNAAPPRGRPSAPPAVTHERSRTAAHRAAGACGVANTDHRAAADVCSWRSTQRSTAASSRCRGSGPPASTAWWKARTSKRGPNRRRARSRSSRNLSCPTL